MTTLIEGILAVGGGVALGIALVVLQSWTVG